MQLKIVFPFEVTQENSFSVTIDSDHGQQALRLELCDSLRDAVDATELDRIYEETLAKIIKACIKIDMK